LVRADLDEELEMIESKDSKAFRFTTEILFEI
jgi:hypothetical protein